jgi:hypothetical protein
MVESNISYMMQDHMKKDQNNYEDRWDMWDKNMRWDRGNMNERGDRGNIANHFTWNNNNVQSLQEKYKAQFETKYSSVIANIPTEKLSQIIDKIDAKIDQVENSDINQAAIDKSVAMLNALKDLINDRIIETTSSISIDELLK